MPLRPRLAHIHKHPLLATRYPPHLPLALALALARTMATTSHSHFTYKPIPAPASASPEHFKDFGRQVEGYVPSEVTPEQTQEIIEMLYKVRRGHGSRFGVGKTRHGCRYERVSVRLWV